MQHIKQYTKSISLTGDATGGTPMERSRDMGVAAGPVKHPSFVLRRSHALSNLLRRSRFMRSTAILSLFLLILATSAILVPVYNNISVTEAATGTAQNSTLTLNITKASASVDLSVHDSNGTFASSSSDDSVSFNIVTNNYTGYELSLGNYNTTTNLVSGSNYLTTIADTISSATFSATNSTDYNGKWGYLPSKYNSTSNTTNYYPAPAINSTTTLDKTSTSNSTANEYTIGVGARATYSQATGTYSNTFTLTAVANRINYSITYNANAGSDTVTNMPSTQAGETSATNITLSSNTPLRTGYTFKGWCTASTSDESCSGTAYQPSDTYYIDQTTINAVTFYAMWEEDAINELTNFTYMQDVTISACNNTDIGQVATIKDSRDNTSYTIGKLADGNCWLLDNLALDLVANKSKLSSSNTNATDAQLAYLKNGGGTASDQYATSGVINWPAGTNSDNYSFSVAYQQASYKDTTGSGGYAAGKYGVYYNYCAASAGTYCYGDGTSHSNPPVGTNAAADICPRGWRIPTGMTSGEYQSLYSQYNDYDEFLTTFRTPLSGSYAVGAAKEQGSRGHYWSSTYFTSVSMGSLGINTSYISASSSYGVGAGGSIRCVLDERTYMQDLTATSIATLLPTEHSTATVYDKRDGQDYTIAKLKDGKYWMTKNLNLAGGTVIESTLSDVPDNYTLSTLNGFQSGNRLPASSTSGFSSDTTAYVYNSNSTNCGNNSPCYSYYSWTAATAGSGLSISANDTDASYSICPKGWKLPTSRSAVAGNSEFYKLAVAYGMPTGNVNNSSPNLYNQAGPGTTPNFLLAGNYGNSSFYDGGSNGRYWSSTSSNNTTAYGLSFNSSNIASAGNYGRRYGFSVRCLFDDRTIADATYMQDITSAMATNTAIGVITKLKDSRDQTEYTVGKLADGNIWLLDNLALDLVANKDKLSSSNTNATDTELSYLKNGGGTTSDRYAIEPVSSEYAAEYSTPIAETRYEDNTGTGGYVAGKYGVYYNYCAASAGTYCYESVKDGQGAPASNASSDICPYGWRLPTGDIEGDYQKLYNLYDDYDLFVSALHTPLSGTTPGLLNANKHGYFWSSTYGTANNMWRLLVTQDSVTASGSGSSRNAAMSVRCIFNS